MYRRTSFICQGANIACRCITKLLRASSSQCVRADENGERGGREIRVRSCRREKRRTSARAFYSASGDIYVARGINATPLGLINWESGGGSAVLLCPRLLRVAGTKSTKSRRVTRRGKILVSDSLHSLAPCYFPFAWLSKKHSPRNGIDVKKHGIPPTRQVTRDGSVTKREVAM